jgi:hypothetical protein
MTKWSGMDGDDHRSNSGGRNRFFTDFAIGFLDAGMAGVLEHIKKF